MAQTGFTPISQYYSTTASAVPTAGNLVNGELALNITDGKIFYKDNAGVVQVIGTKGGVGSSTTTQVLYNSSGLVVGSANMTFSGTALTLANDASISGLTVGKGGGANTYNTAVGNLALQANSTGSNNTAIGFNTSYYQTGSYNTAVGQAAFAGASGSSGNYNSAFGNYALNVNTSGSNNTGLGYQALQANTTASNNTAVGYQAGYSNTTGGNGTFVGYQAGYTNQTGFNIVAIGWKAGYSFNNSSGIDGDVYIGQNAGYGVTTGHDNTYVGNTAGYQTTSGVYNTALGGSALNATTTGAQNTALGWRALFSNTTASNNTAVGYQAGYSNTTGTGNTFVGRDCGRLSTGSYNTFIGGFVPGTAGCGDSMTTGSKNTIIGLYNGNQGGLDIRTASNYIVLSDGDGNPRGIFDNSGFFRVDALYYNTTATAANMNIATDGYLRRSTSALKYKTNVRDLPSKDINQLRAVVYNSNCDGDDKTKDHFGVIADEAQTSFPELITYGAEGEVEGFQYERLTVVLLKSLQELKAEFDAYKSTHP